MARILWVGETQGNLIVHTQTPEISSPHGHSTVLRLAADGLWQTADDGGIGLSLEHFAAGRRPRYMYSGHRQAIGNSGLPRHLEKTHTTGAAKSRSSGKG